VSFCRLLAAIRLARRESIAAAKYKRRKATVRNQGPTRSNGRTTTA
jgi:hypothetical protein